MQIDLWVKQYTNYLILEKGLSDQSVDAYSRDAEKFKFYLEEYAKLKSADDIDADVISTFAFWLDKLDLAPKSRARIISGVKSFLNFLLLEKLISTDYTGFLISPKLDRKIPSILSLEDIDKMLEASLIMTADKVVNLRNYAIIELFFATGIRVSELITLQRKHVDFDEERIRVKGKGKKERMVPFHNNAQEALKAYWKAEAEFSLKPTDKKPEFAFLNRRKNAITRNMVFILIKNLGILAGVKKKVSPHLFRHTFASHLIQAGADIRVVQLLLGHESILTTEVYTHFKLEHLRTTMENCHPLFQSAQ